MFNGHCHASLILSLVEVTNVYHKKSSTQGKATFGAKLETRAGVSAFFKEDLV